MNLKKIQDTVAKYLREEMGHAEAWAALIAAGVSRAGADRILKNAAANTDLKASLMAAE